MTIRLGEIADIQFGPHGRGEETGEVKYLLGRHFGSLNKPNLFEKSYISITEKQERLLLKSGDVILAGKGLRIFAWAYQEEFGKCIASSLFYLLRPKTNKVIGQYLAHFLNTDKIQHKLKLIGSGATIISIPKKELAEVKIEVPDLKKQMTIVERMKLLDKDITLTQQLLEKKKLLRKGVINHIITNQTTTNK